MSLLRTPAGCDPWPLVEARHTDQNILVILVDLEHITVQPALLDERERERGNRLRTPLLQHLFFASHTAMRQILGWQLQVDPARLVFTIDPRGKPTLIETSEVFSLSHSGSLALIAMATDGAVGVDLESGARIGDLDHVAERVFAPTEHARYLALPPSLRPRVFLTAWTRKEAALKALGIGLPGGMENVVMADDPPHLRGDYSLLPGLTDLQVVDLPAIAGYAAALSYGPRPRAVRCARWPHHRNEH